MLIDTSAGSEMVALRRRGPVRATRRGVSVSAVLPSAVDTALASGLDMKPIPKVTPEKIAAAVLGSVSSRKAEIAAPRHVGALAALTPEPVLNVVRRLVRDDRALQPDSDERAACRSRLLR